MARASRQHPSARARARHGRHGRSPVTGPHLPLAHTRRDLFETTVQSTAEYLVDLWPDELANLRIEVMPMPDQPNQVQGVARWRVNADEHLVVLYRIPIERMSRLHRDDDWHRRLMVESCVFRAVGELIGKDPWDLAPERFRHW
ncbi:metallopeptidase family protein [Microcella sp.]|uniref:metallopeptidase family protein n=1 Tax=Microcella sp. TaxID=1913979 RepID=UPI00256CE14F|nr:metallopeptidase family protein [Microcella sp.]MBX9472758.1 metallopeptidase family protein [Microcella sp.]